MTFPQIPLGDDGELDIDDSREIPVIHVYKPKHTFLRSNWLFICYVILFLLPLSYWFLTIYVVVPASQLHLDQPIRYGLVIFIEDLPYPLLVFIGLCSFFCLIVVLNSSSKGKKDNLLILLIPNFIACGTCGVDAFSDSGLQHQDTFEINRRIYQLAVFEEEDLDMEYRKYVIYECPSNSLYCTPIYTSASDEATSDYYQYLSMEEKQLHLEVSPSGQFLIATEDEVIRPLEVYTSIKPN
jgi:hypothetical protein